MTKGPNAFRTISEASGEVGAPQHVLRFWETKFPFLTPLKRAGGRRFYRPQDIAVLRGVRALLHDEGYTIKGVQKLHKEQGVRRLSGAGEAGGASLPLASAEVDMSPAGPTDIGGETRDRLSFALADLEAVKARLDGLLKGR